MYSFKWVQLLIHNHISMLVWDILCYKSGPDIKHEKDILYKIIPIFHGTVNWMIKSRFSSKKLAHKIARNHRTEWRSTRTTNFLHDRPWISPWIKTISNELVIIIHVITSQLTRYCDVIGNRFWRHQQNEDRACETRGRCVKIVVLFVIHGFELCHV